MRRIEGYHTDYDFSGFRKIADLIYFEGPLLSHYVSSRGDDYLELHPKPYIYETDSTIISFNRQFNL